MNTPTHDGDGTPRPVLKKLGFIETIQHILRKDGIPALWRGLGPALVLVMNPVLQYTVFEQLKNLLIKRRTAKLRLGGSKSAVGGLTDIDFFFLGAVSKLGVLHSLCRQDVDSSFNSDWMALQSLRHRHILICKAGRPTLLRILKPCRILQRREEQTPSRARGGTPLQVCLRRCPHHYKGGRRRGPVQGRREQARAERLDRRHSVCWPEEDLRDHEEGTPSFYTTMTN